MILQDLHVTFIKEFLPGGHVHGDPVDVIWHTQRCFRLCVVQVPSELN